MNCNAAPIIIIGPHGGGTSFVTKLLRMVGLNAGSDASPLGARKTHESKRLNNINKTILDIMKVTGIYSSGRTNQVVKEVTHYWEHLHCRETEQIIKELIGDVDWESIFGVEYKKSVWGWKDPRNSISLPFWLSQFPKSTVLSIKKRPVKGEAQSKSGDWFKNQAEPSILDFYVAPIGIESAQHSLIIEFERFCKDWKYFNEVVGQLDLTKVKNEDSFIALLTDAGYEQKELLK